MPDGRRFYRVVFPIGVRPQLVVGGTRYEVVDCSEGGLRLRAGANHGLELGAELAGELRLLSRTTVSVRGEVVRIQGSDVALRLSPLLPFAVVMSEQRILRARGFIGALR